MGTDIHLFVEKQDAAGKWQAAKLPCGGHRGHADRNYDVFAILADVRNGRGFAGVVTGDGFNLIAEPRGLPDDISATLKPENQPEYDEETGELPAGTVRLWLGDHSFSWLLASEVKSFDWSQVATHQGVVGIGEYISFLRTGTPSAWCGSVWGPKIRNVPEADMRKVTLSAAAVRPLESAVATWALALHGSKDREKWKESDTAHLRAAVENYEWWVANRSATWFSDDVAEAGVDYRTSVRWNETYESCARNFLAWFNEVVVPLGDPDKVRLVFGFDS